jgi:hypothetical protein
MRASDGRPAPADSAAGGPLSVQTLLDSARLALPDTSEFSFRPYGVRFTPDYVSRPTIGYTRDNFGGGISGGTTIQMSDILGNHTLGFSGMVNGRLSEAQVEAIYVNSTHRLNWAVGASQVPFFYYGQSSWGEVGAGTYGGTVLTQQLVRYVYRQAIAQGIYPINRFQRFELGARLTNISVSTLTLMTEVDLTGYPISYQEATSNNGGVTFVQPTLAYVKDNSLFGYTSSFYGSRYRLEVAPTIGEWRFTQLTADLRRYLMIAFPFSVSVRALAMGRVGRDGDRIPLYIGNPDLVRGYTYPSFSPAECSAASSTSYSGCPELDQLIGSRIAVFNAEFRFPLTRSLVLGFLPVGFPPIEAALFYDAGLAWNSGSKLFRNRPDSADVATGRWPMTSYGVGIRINLLGFTVLRIDYAVPLQRRYTNPEQTSKHGYWIVSLGPPF